MHWTPVCLVLELGRSLWKNLKCELYFKQNYDGIEFIQEYVDSVVCFWTPPAYLTMNSSYNYYTLDFSALLKSYVAQYGHQKSYMFASGWKLKSLVPTLNERFLVAFLEFVIQQTLFSCEDFLYVS